MEHGNVYKLLDRPVFVVLLLFPLLQPLCFNYFATTDRFFLVYKLLAALVIGLIYLTKVISKSKISSIMLLIFFFCGWQLVSTLVMSGSLYEWIKHSAPLAALCMLSELVIKRDWRVLVKSLFILLGFETVINFIVYLLFPQGIYMQSSYTIPGWFISPDNWFPVILLPAVLFGFLMYLEERTTKNRICVASMYMLVTVQFAMTQSATSLLGWAFFTLFIALVIFVRPVKLSRLVKGASLFVSYVTIYVCIVFLRLQTLLVPIITGVFHKSVSLTNRTFIWDAEMAYIRRSLFIGHGARYHEEGFWFRPVQSRYYWGSHNYILNIASVGGLVSVAIFVGTVSLCMYKLYRCRRHPFAILIASMIWIFLIMMIMENYLTDGVFYILLLFGYHISRIISKTENPRLLFVQGNHMVRRPRKFSR